MGSSKSVRIQILDPEIGSKTVVSKLLKLKLGKTRSSGERIIFDDNGSRVLIVIRNLPTDKSYNELMQLFGNETIKLKWVKPTFKKIKTKQW